MIRRCPQKVACKYYENLCNFMNYENCKWYKKTINPFIGEKSRLEKVIREDRRR